MVNTEGANSARQEAESVAGGPGAAPAMPAATIASRGSNQEVSSGAHTASDGTMSLEPSNSDGDALPAGLLDSRLCVPVVTGSLRGIYLVQQNRVVCGGRELTPTQFEAAGGRESCRKWRTSLRVLLPDGTPGKGLGMWLKEHGYDTRSLPTKRKWDLPASQLLQGLHSSASEPSSPAGRQLSLSPTKSARLEQSLPGSPCCPHCRRGGGGSGRPTATSLPTSQCSAGSEGSHQHAGASSQVAAIKRQLEAFLASLPPSAQVALGPVVGGAAEAPPPQQPFPHHAQQQRPMAPPFSLQASAAAVGDWEAQAKPAMLLPSTVPVRLPSLPGPVPPPGPAQQQWLPMPPPARPMVFPPLPPPAYYALPPYPYPPSVPMPHPGPPQWWGGAPVPQGDAAHYLISEMGVKPARPKQPRRSRAASAAATPRTIGMPPYIQRTALQRLQRDGPGSKAALILQQQLWMLQQQQEQQKQPPQQQAQQKQSGSHGNAAVEADRPDLKGCTGAVPAVGDSPADGPQLSAASEPRPDSQAAQSLRQDGQTGSTGGTPPVPSVPLMQTQGSTSGLAAGDVPLGAAPPTKTEAAKAAPATQAGPHHAAATAAQQQQGGGEPGGAIDLGPEDDLDWLLQEGNRLDLSALLGQDASPQPQGPTQRGPQGQAGASGAGAEAEGVKCEPELGPELLPFSPLAGGLLTPLHALYYGGTPLAAAGARAPEGAPGGADDGDGEQVDLLAELLRSVLPSPSEGALSPLPLASPSQPPLRQRLLLQRQVEERDAGGVEGEVLEEAAAEAKSLPSLGSSFDLKVFAGMPPHADGALGSKGMEDPGFRPATYWMDL